MIMKNWRQCPYIHTKINIFLNPRNSGEFLPKISLENLSIIYDLCWNPRLLHLFEKNSHSFELRRSKNGNMVKSNRGRLLRNPDLAATTSSICRVPAKKWRPFCNPSMESYAIMKDVDGGRLIATVKTT
ncbi:hypothetical protein ACP275_08G095800 [Erythranthe tilingii]